ncbi:transposase [Lysobacter sp. CA199]|uniref:transposase n=1 Tax=Lysobacter sp. CA199 TaxID=3455608 RepID=UPI003F8D84C2
MSLFLVQPREFQLGDEQWKILASHLPRQYQSRIVNNTGNYRAFIEAVLWVVANDAPWTGIPRAFGSWRAIYVRFLRWVEDEHWIAVERGIGLDSALAARLRERVERYRASNRWRRKRSQQRLNECAENRGLESEMFRRWGLVQAG